MQIIFINFKIHLEFLFYSYTNLISTTEERLEETKTKDVKQR